VKIIGTNVYGGKGEQRSTISDQQTAISVQRFGVVELFREKKQFETILFSEKGYREQRAVNSEIPEGARGWG
jgi:hypothetical protein